MYVYKTVAAGDIAWQLCICTLLLSVFPPHSHQIAHFQRHGKCHYFCAAFLCQCIVSTEQALIDFVSGCAEVHATLPLWFW